LNYLDLDSFVMRYLVDEISKNLDAGYSSYYFYKPRGESKLYAGPVWDYDTSLGNNMGWGDSAILKNPEGMYANQSNWSAKLWEKEEFRIRAAELYTGIFHPWLEEFLDTGYDSLAEKISDSVSMELIFYDRIPEEDCVAQMKEFLEKRAAFLKDEFRVE